MWTRGLFGVGQRGSSSPLISPDPRRFRGPVGQLDSPCPSGGRTPGTGVPVDSRHDVPFSGPTESGPLTLFILLPLSCPSLSPSRVSSSGLHRSVRTGRVWCCLQRVSSGSLETRPLTFSPLPPPLVKSRPTLVHEPGHFCTERRRSRETPGG